MKLLYVVIAAVVNVVLLAVILVSCAVQKPSSQPAQQPPADSSGITAELQSPVPVAKAPSAQETQTIPETDAQTEPLTEPVTDTEPSATESAIPTEPASVSGMSDDYSTDASATYQDMAGTYLHGSDGFLWQDLPEDAAPLTNLADVLGGWKAYLVSNPDDNASSVNHLLNIRLFGTEQQLTVTFDWDYYYIIATAEEGYSTDPDSEYIGAWTDGEATAAGSGVVRLYDFRYADGKQYALGTFTWPDGTPGAIALVRP